MVGRQALNVEIGVRIPVPEHARSECGGGAMSLRALHWDSNAGAMREFSRACRGKGERREAWLGGNFRQEIYRRGIPVPEICLFF